MYHPVYLGRGKEKNPAVYHDIRIDQDYRVHGEMEWHQHVVHGLVTAVRLLRIIGGTVNKRSG